MAEHVATPNHDEGRDLKPGMLPPPRVRTYARPPREKLDPETHERLLNELTDQLLTLDGLDLDKPEIMNRAWKRYGDDLD